MLMGHGEDDAGTSEAVIDSGGGGESWRALDKTWGKVRAGALPSLGCWQIQRLVALGAPCCRRSGARRAAEEEEQLEALMRQGRAADAGRTSGCKSDERAQRLIGWAEKPKDYMINRHRGAWLSGTAQVR